MRFTGGSQCGGMAAGRVPTQKSEGHNDWGKRMRRPVSVAPPKGKLGILTPGMGAVSTTFMAGEELVRRGHYIPVGSLTRMGRIGRGKRTDGQPDRAHLGQRSHR